LPKTGSGKGTLAYTVTFPNLGTDGSKSLALYAVTKNGETAETPVTDFTSGTSGTVNDLPAGFYRLGLSLTNSAEQTAARTDAVHIYAGLTTTAAFDFAGADFGEALTGGGETIGPLTLGELSTALAGLSVNTAANPHTVKLDSSVTIDTSDYSYDGSIFNPNYTGIWATVNKTVKSAGKYVILDLSECSAEGNRITGPLFSPSNPYGCNMNIIKDNSYIKGIALPYSLTRIGINAFYDCDWLTSVTIPASVTSIEEYAFYWCEGLTSVTMPAGLADDFDDAYIGSVGLSVVLTGPGSVADDAFDKCTELVSVTIGPGVTGVGEDTFDGCVNLATVAVDEANTEYSSVDGVLFNKNKTSLLYCPQGRTGSYTIPSGVTSIADYAFEDCSALTTTIPPGVTSIGSGAFYNCSALTGALTIPLGVTSIGSNTFYNCTGLTGVTIPDSVTSIGRGAFYNCTGLTSVTIPESVTSIGAYIFGSSGGSGGIIGYHWEYGAFDKCSALSSLTIPAGLTARFADKFTGYSNLAVVLTGTGSIPNSAFTSTLRQESNSWSDCTGITSVTIGDSVADIGQAAFSGCTGLASITIGAGVSSFWTNSFSGCTSLERITVDTANTTYFSSQNIWYNRIRGSVALVPQKISGSITIPEGITTIGERAFEGRTGLTSVTIPNSVDKLEKFFIDIIQSLIPFGNTISDTEYLDGVSTIGSYAFAGCTKLERVTFKGPGIYDHNNYVDGLLDAASMLYHIVSQNYLATISDFLGMGIDNSLGFYDNAFPQGNSDSGGNDLKTKYLAEGAGTYTRTAGGWTK
jgi:hypothetical protein